MDDPHYIKKKKCTRPVVDDIVDVIKDSSDHIPPAEKSSTFSCFDYKIRTDGDKLELVDCLLIEEPEESQITNPTSSSNMFVIDLQCQSTKIGFCEKAKKNLDRMGEIITKAIQFKVPVVVNISFIPIEIVGGNLMIGAAGPSRMFGLKDEDGVVRMYPQSLVKQFRFNTHLEFLPFDITAVFNSDVDFWFEDDTTPIMPTQFSFEYVALHEFMHGLGFLSNWRLFPTSDAVNATGLMPLIITSPVKSSSDSSIIFIGFYETIFDKFIRLLPNGVPLTYFTNLLNTFAPKGTKFDSLDDFYAKLENSAQYKIATDMLNYATTPLSFGFLKKGLDIKDAVVNYTANDDLVYLETSFKPPIPGSSMNHVSYALYMHSVEFLMTYRLDPGSSLQDAIREGGNYVGGAIGPKLISILESLGYTTTNNPNPEIPTIPDLLLFLD